MAVALVDKQYLIAHFPEFSDTTKYSEERIGMLNETASRYASESAFGSDTRYARMLIIAHLMKLGDLQGSGAVVSEKVGDLARSYASPSQDNFAQTSYGQAFDELARRKARGSTFIA